MNKHLRLQKVAELVLTNGQVAVEQIVEKLGVSPATARRDLDELAAQQMITRTRGGAVANPVSGDLPVRYRAGALAEEKQRLARAAAALVQPGEVIGLNGGTTTTEIAREIALRVGEQPGFAEHPVTIITNAVNIAFEMAVRPQLRVVMTGGTVRANSFELVGPLASRVLPALSIGRLFLGVVAFDPEHGAYNSHEGEAAINAALVEAAQQVTVVADSSKIGRRALALICPAGAIDSLVTDSAPTAEQAAALAASEIKVIVPPEVPTT